MFFSTIVRTLRRLHCIEISYISPIINKLKFIGMGIKMKGGGQIIGRCSITVERTAKAIIGENFRLVSSNLYNPLCKNKTCISISKGATLSIGDNVGMSSPTIWIRQSLTIGNHVNLGGGVCIMDSDAHSLDYRHRRNGATDMANRIDKGIIIEDDVLVGAYAIILKGVRIGARSVIGAGSVVTKDIPSDCIAAGNPAKIIRYLNI